MRDSMRLSSTGFMTQDGLRLLERQRMNAVQGQESHLLHGFPRRRVVAQGDRMSRKNSPGFDMGMLTGGVVA